MKVKEFHRPKTVEEALELLGTKENARIIAGGTDLVIALRERQQSADVLIDITGIPELVLIDVVDGVLHVGAAVNFTALWHSPQVREHCPALSEAASQVGAEQIRNRATVGGNIANAATGADSLPPLLCADAKVVVASAHGKRVVPVSQLVCGVNQNTLQDNELICEFLLPVVPGTAMVFEKIGRRKALAISRISLAVAATMDGPKVENLRAAVGAVGKTAYRLTEVEEFLKGKELREEVILSAARLADDVVAKNLAGRSTTPYKRKIAAAVMKRGLGRIAGGEGN